MVINNFPFLSRYKLFGSQFQDRSRIDVGRHGTGKIASSLLIDEQIERKLAFYVTEKGLKSLTLKVSPILGAYLTRGLFSSFLGKWKKKYKCKINLVEVTDFSVLQNEFYDVKGDLLD